MTLAHNTQWDSENGHFEGPMAKERNEAPNVQISSLKRLTSLLARGMALSQKHHYRHEALLKEEVVADLGKLEDIMAGEDKSYWAIQELRDAMGVSSHDLAQQTYINNLIGYLKDEGIVVTGGANSPNRYTLVKRHEPLIVNKGLVMH